MPLRKGRRGWERVIAGVLLSTGVAFANFPAGGALPTLAQIYAEVKAIGPNSSENFIRQDVFIGKPDDDDTNKDVYVGILIQPSEGTEKMTLLVTALVRSKSDPRAKDAGPTRTLTCRVGRDGVRILNSEFSPTEVEKLAADVLRAVRDKKKLIKGGGPARLGR